MVTRETTFRDSGTIRTRAIDFDIVPDGRTCVRMRRAFGHNQVLTLFEASVRHRTLGDCDVLIEGIALLIRRDRAVQSEILADRKPTTDMNLRTIGCQFIGMKDRAFGYVNLALTSIDFPSCKFAVLCDERTFATQFDTVDPTDSCVSNTPGAHRERAVFDLNKATVGCVRKELVAIVVTRGPIKVFWTRTANKDKFLVIVDGNFVCMSDVLEAHRRTDYIGRGFITCTNHETRCVRTLSGLIMQSRGIKDNTRIEHVRLTKFFLFSNQFMCRFNREVAHEVAKEVLRNILNTSLVERVLNRCNEFDREVVIVKGNHAATFERKTT